MEHSGSLVNLLWAFAFIATGGLLFGYIIGINSNVLTPGQLLCPDGYTGTVGTWGSWGYGQCYHLTPGAQGVLSSLNLIGACASSLLCFRYADSMGRKLEVQMAGLLYMLGAVVAALLPVLWGTFLGFLIYGFGVGFAMHAAPVYIAEISPAAVRGRLVSAKEAVIVLGIFLGFLSGYAFSGVAFQGWRLMVACSGVLGLAMVMGIAGVPQSPRFLLLQGARRPAAAQALREEARRALRFFRRAGAGEVEEELQGLEKDLRAALQEDTESQSLLGPRARRPGALEAFRYEKPMVVGCGLVLLQQVTGQTSVLYFANQFLRAAGFGNSAAMQSVWIGLVKLVATLFAVWQVDSYGRRKLLFVGISMMAAALVLLTLSSCLPPALTVVALMQYVSGYQVGFGPIAWLMISEVFPLKVRGSALSVAVVINFGSNIAMTVATPVLLASLKPAGLYAIFLVLTFASLVFVHAYVPETKGKSLEEIEEMMTS
mmetsp:Transcript_28759/g.82313  ORF Transcript_28759/g.82313 Transcript_28759/m.82313 type:complete len:486 (+) Transcript_28759:85-1542(+)